MSRKKKQPKFGWQSVVRIVVLVAIVAGIVWLLPQENIGSKMSLPSIDVNKIWLLIPEDGREKIGEIPKNPAIIGVQQKMGQVLGQWTDFPQKQIKEIQIGIIQRVSEMLIQNVKK